MSRFSSIKLVRNVCVASISLWLVSSFAQERAELFATSHDVVVEPGVTIHVVNWGGEGPPVLFLPAWGNTAHVYDDFVPRFTDSYRVLVMDTRGHGLSSPANNGFNIPRLIEDIEAILDEFDIEKVNLVGLSRSSSLTSHFAAAFPERVQSLVYLSGPIDRARWREFYEVQENLFIGYRNSATEEAIRALCYIGNEEYDRPEGSFEDSADEIGVEWRNSDPSPPYGKIQAPALAFWAPERGRADRYRETCSRFSDWDVARVLIDRYEEVSEPVFELMDHDMEIYLTQLSDRELVEIPGAFYHTFVSHPEIVEREMRQFLKRTNL